MTRLAERILAGGRRIGEGRNWVLGFWVCDGGSGTSGVGGGFGHERDGTRYTWRD